MREGKVMELLSKINLLNQKQRNGIIFQEEDKKLAQEISECGSSYYKSKLIDILAYEKEEWSYKILKTMIYDQDEMIAEKAVDIVGVSFKKEHDFWELFEEAENTNVFVKSWIVTITGYIGLQRGIEDDMIIKRLKSLLRMNEEAFYIQLMIYEWLFLRTGDNNYLQKILSGIGDLDYEVRYQAFYVLNDILSDGELLNQEMLEKVKQLLCAGRKNELRYHRIYRERIFWCISEKMGKKSSGKYIDQKENQFFLKISTAFHEHTTVDNLLTYCIFKMYYPIKDEIEEVLKLLRDYASETEDERFLFFAAYVECKYGDEINNIFLDKLQDKELQGEKRAVVLLIQALWELELNPEDLCNKKALELAESALGYSTDIPRVFDIIMQLTSIETIKHRWAKQKSAKLKKKILLEEIDRWPLETLYSYDTFLNMTILRKIEEPENFMLKNTFWKED